MSTDLNLFWAIKNMKRCNYCNNDKPLDDFSKDKSRKDGLNIKCKTCRKEYRNKRNHVSIDYQRQYRKSNKDKISENKKNYQKEKRNTDSLFKLKSYLRSRVWSILKNNKDKETEELLGTSFQKVKEHLTTTFTEGMTWDNYGQWHVDHKIPLASAKTKEEVEKLFHYTNLQALWALDNQIKSSKLI